MARSFGPQLKLGLTPIAHPNGHPVTLTKTPNPTIEVLVFSLFPSLIRSICSLRKNLCYIKARFQLRGRIRTYQPYPPDLSLTGTLIGDQAALLVGLKNRRLVAFQREEVVNMPRSRRSSSSSDSDYGAPIRITKTQVLPVARSHSGRHRHHSPDTVVVNANSFLQLPGQARRARASSTSGQPAPVINNFYADDRSRSHSRHRDRPDSSGSSDYHHSRSRHRHSSHLPIDALVDLRLADLDREEREREKAVKQAVRDAKIREEEDKRDRERIIFEAKLKEAADKQKAEEKKKEIIEKWQQEEREKNEKKDREKKEADEKYEEKLKLDLLLADYTPYEIENILKKRKEKEGHNRRAIERARPTFIRVATKYLSTATLDAYNLPWEYDRVSTCKIFRKTQRTDK